MRLLLFQMQLAISKITKHSTSQISLYKGKLLKVLYNGLLAHYPLGLANQSGQRATKP